MSAKAKGVIYIKRNGLNYYATDRTDVLVLDYPQTATQDLEIVSRDEVVQQLKNFITVNKILPSRSIIILSNGIFFWKDIIVPKPEELDPQIKSFLNNVPFEHVTFKTFDVDKAKRVLAVNKDLYQYVKEFLEKNGFTVSQIVAPLSLGKEFTLGENLTLDQAKAIISKMDVIKHTENFIEQPVPQIPPGAEGSFVAVPKKKKAKSTLPLLLPVFALLIAVLGGVYYMQMQQNKTFIARGEQVVSPFPTSAQIAAPTPEPTASISSESAALQKKTTKIQVLNGSRITGQAELGRRQLNAVGYEDVKTGNADSAATTKTLIIFTKNVPDYIRSDIVAQLAKTYEEISTQETESAQYDVIITLGRIIAATPTVTP